MDGPLNRATRLVSWFVRPFAGQEPSFYRAVTACLLAAGVFWQMNALNKTYTTRLNYPIAWSYDSVRYLPMRPLPEALPVTVTGQGWRLLRANLGWGTQPAVLRPVPLPGTRYLPPDAWQRGLNNAFEGVEFTEWSGDTLRLTFDRYATRQLKLALPPDSARYYTARFTPSSLSFRGPASVVNNLPDPYPIPAAEMPAPDSDDEADVILQLPARVRISAKKVSLIQKRKAGVPRPSKRRASSFIR